MGKSTPSAPAAPDPVATADAQSAANTKAAIAQANLNRIDQVTPQGSITYGQIGTNPDGTPRYQQTQTYSPEQQKLYEQQNAIAQSLGGLAQGNIGRVNDAQSKPFTFDGMTPLKTGVNGDYSGAVKAAQDAAYGQATARLDPQWQQSESDTRARLANSGITENSDAYRREMDNMGRAKSDAYSSARDQAFQQGMSAQNQGFNQEAANVTMNNQGRQQQIDEASYLRNMPLNDIAALLGTGGGVQGPNFNPVSQVGVAAPDYQGAVYANYNAQNQQYQAAMQARSQGLGSIFGLAGSLGSAAIMSDRNLKHNIRRIGTLANGLATYVFSYIGSTARQFGVMAQDVLRINPRAVVVADNGYMAVDYSKVW